MFYGFDMECEGNGAVMSWNGVLLGLWKGLEVQWSRVCSRSYVYLPCEGCGITFIYFVCESEVI
jgi:hypothetical protein